MVSAGYSNQGHRYHSGPQAAAVDIAEIVRGIHENAAYRRPYEAPVDVRRVCRRELSRPFGSDRAARVSDQPDFRYVRQPGGG